MRRIRHILPLILICLPAGVSFSAPDEAVKPQSPPAKSEGKADQQVSPAAPEEVPRFTNAELPPLRREDMDREAAAGGTSAGDGVQTQNEEADETLDEVLEGVTDETLRASLAEARKEIAMLEIRLEHLNSRLLSVQNAYLRGVTPPSHEEEKAVGGAANEERLSWVKDQIAAAEKLQVEARARFQTLLRR